MKISELITQLQQAQTARGDLKLSIFDGFIQNIRIIPSKDGIEVDQGANELTLEIMSEFA